jgi:threonine dehydrogenase-like Zn-dependent dehydrogenase
MNTLKSTMKIARHPGKSVVAVDEVPVPQPGPGEVLIQTVASALCGSEMGSYRNAGVPSGNNGHEAAGFVAALGEGVTNLRVGERVGACPVAGCGDCEYCAQGKNTWCDNKRFYGAMHAEYFLASARWCQP